MRSTIREGGFQAALSLLLTLVVALLVSAPEEAGALEKRESCLAMGTIQAQDTNGNVLGVLNDSNNWDNDIYVITSDTSAAINLYLCYTSTAGRYNLRLAVCSKS